VDRGINLNLEDVFKKFAKEITNIQQQKSNHERIAKQSVELTNKTIEKLVDDNFDFPASTQNMCFDDINGETKIYGHVKQSFEDLKDSQFHIYKLQLQWLLVNAYEYFEIYIKNLYMLCANENNIWKLKHFGSLTLQEVENLSEDEIKELAMKVETNEILNIFRGKLPNYKLLEVNNKIGVDLKFFIKIIEKLRHIIVHNNGYVKNKQKFTNKIFQELGYATNNKNSDELIGVLNLFFDENDFVDLRKIVGKSYGVFVVHHCKFSILIEKMMCLSDLLRMEIEIYNE